MSFNEYVDDLAKRGIIDGHIAQMLVGKHADEVANPSKPIEGRVMPILDRMWSYARTNGIKAVADFASDVDDALFAKSEIADVGNSSIAK